MSNQEPEAVQRVAHPIVDPFANVVSDTERGGDAYARFAEAFRTLQDTVVTSSPPLEIWEEAADQVDALIAQLEPFAAPERQRPAGMRIDLPGRGNPMLVPFVWDFVGDGEVRGRATFRPLHIGGNGAAHGGTVPLLFDEVLGRVANTGFANVARTAFLKVNYRQVTPIGVELDVVATVDLVEGRKRWATGRLTKDGVLLADAEALFIELLPGQP